MRQLYVKDLSSYSVEGIDFKDYPEFAEAFIAEAFDKNGVELTDEELEWLHDNDTMGVYAAVEEASCDAMAQAGDDAMDAHNDYLWGV